MQEVSVTTLDATEVVPSLYEPFAGSALPAGWQTPLASVPTVGGGKLTLHPTAGDSCLAVLPPLHGVAASDVTMALRLQGTAGCRLVAGVMDYALEAESFVPLDTLVCGSSWQRHVVDFSPYSGSGLHLALLALGDGTVAVDDLRVARCLVDSVQFSYLADSSVTVAWDTLTPLANAVTVEYGPRGIDRCRGIAVRARLESRLPQHLHDSRVIADAVNLEVAPQFEGEFRLSPENTLLHTPGFVPRESPVESRFADLGVRVAFQNLPQFREVRLRDVFRNHRVEPEGRAVPFSAVIFGAVHLRAVQVAHLSPFPGFAAHIHIVVTAAIELVGDAFGIA
jgi:hypothetical protein